MAFNPGQIAAGAGIGSLAGGVVGQAVGLAFAPLNALVSGWINAQLSESNYNQQINKLQDKRFIVPDSTVILDAYSRGFIGKDEAEWYVGFSGIPWRENRINLMPQGQARLAAIEDHNLWERLRYTALSRPGISDALNLLRFGHITRPQTNELIKRAGGSVLEWSNLYESIFVPMDLGPLIASRNRDLITHEQFEKGLDHLGYIKPLHKFLFDSLREVIPPISDLISFAIRDVWDQAAVAANRPFEEFPAGMRQWTNSQGLTGSSGIDKQGQNGGGIANWAEVYWASHWQPISPSQAYDMYHRLRAGRFQRFQRMGLNVGEFTLADLNRWIKIADYPSGIRDQLAAMSYQPLGLRQIRAALKVKANADLDRSYRNSLDPVTQLRVEQFTDQWAIDQYRDRGLHPDDAQSSVTILKAEVLSELSQPLRAYTRRLTINLIKETIASYNAGVITEEECKDKLVENGLSRADAIRATSMENMKVTKRIVVTATANIRRDFLTGILLTSEMETSLLQAGLTAEAVANLSELWTMQLNRRRKTASTQQLLGWFEQGLVSQQEMLQRLSNLGWSNPDQLTLLRGAGLAVQKLQAKTITAAAANQRSQAKQLEAVQRETKTLVRRQIADLRAAMPRISIQGWLRKGLVSVAWARARLLAQAWPLETIELWIRESVEPSVTKNKGPSNGT